MNNIFQDTPIYTRMNPPGLAQLSYREGTYLSVLKRLRYYLITQRNTNVGLPLPLDIYDEKSWAVGLLESWAMVIDVLTFYQERIANEGYLGTATEQRSIMELVMAIGYEMHPGLAASTYLAFTVQNEQQGEPSRHYMIPQGIAVQSVPTQGLSGVALPDITKVPVPAQLPQVFETSADFMAYPSWNAIQPVKAPAVSMQPIWSGTASLRLDGTKPGLNKGDALLIVGEAQEGQGRPWLFALVKTVTPNTKKGFTDISWDNDVDSNTNTRLTNPSVFVLQKQAKLYAYTRGGIYFTPINTDSADCSPSGIGLPNTEVHALVQHASGALLAATDNGVFRSVNKGETWEATSSGLMKMKISALTTTANGKLYAGTTNGSVFYSLDIGNNWYIIVNRVGLPAGLSALLAGTSPTNNTLPKTEVHALATFTQNRRNYLAAAMDSGIYLSEDDGLSWQQPPSDTVARGAALAFSAPSPGIAPLVGMNTGVFPVEMSNWRNALFRRSPQGGRPLPSIPVNALAFRQSSTIFAGTPLGIFRSQDNALNWAPIPNEPTRLLGTIPIDANVQVADLNARRISDGLRKALTDMHVELAQDAVLQIEAQGQRWSLSVLSKFSLYRLVRDQSSLQVYHISDIRAFEFSNPQHLFAASRAGRIFRSQGNGESWNDFADNVPLNPIRGLLATSDGMFIAGMPDDSGAETQWSRFHIQNKQLDLDKIYPDIAEESWLVLRQERQAALYKVVGTTTRNSDDFKRSKDFSRITVDSTEYLDNFDRTTAIVYTVSKPLALFNFEPIQGQTLTCAPFESGLKEGQQGCVSGKRIRVRLARRTTDPLTLNSTDNKQQMQLTRDSTFVLMAQPVLVDAASNTYTWKLQDINGTIWQVKASIDTFSYELANDQDEIVSEIMTVLSVTSGSGQSQIITFQKALQNVYDPTMVTFNANVVMATHGQRVQDEVLGSANLSADNRRFTLKNKPLTYLPSAAGDNTPASTLEVAVNDVPWKEEQTLFGQGSNKRVYVLRRDSQDNTTVIFGDGNEGARLPSGREHIRASYRYGSGNAGNVPANSLITIRTRPYGVQSATNPLAASGGTDAEPQDQAKTRAPQLIQTMQRIVSLKDYEAFTRIFRNISKVQARDIWDGRTHLVHLTIASSEDTTITEESAVYKVLVTALIDEINKVAASPSQALKIQLYQCVYFQLGATLIIADDYATKQNTVAESVKQMLLSAFSFDKREFGQPVSSSEIISLMQGVEGVYAVELTCLSTGDAGRLDTLLQARPARLEQGQIHPAQLLLIDPSERGISLSTKGQDI